MIEAITFDFFQTLVTHRSGDYGRGKLLIDYLESNGLSPKNWRHQIIYRVMEGHAHDYSPYDTVNKKQAYFEDLARQVFLELGVDFTKADPAKHALAIWKIIGPESLHIYPDVPDTLDNLRSSGYSLAIISNWHCGLHNYCIELGIAKFFDHIIASAEVGISKPDHRIFEQASLKLEVPIEGILHVGDSVAEDIQGANSAGMQALLIDRKDLFRRQHSITELTEIVPYLACSIG